MPGFPLGAGNACLPQPAANLAQRQAVTADPLEDLPNDARWYVADDRGLKNVAKIAIKNDRKPKLSRCLRLTRGSANSTRGRAKLAKK
jgi:hypothetical protein